MREFDGWTAKTETEYEYDGDGRLVRSVQWAQSAWDETQRGWMLALAEYEAGRCPVCGGDPVECQSPDVDRNNPRSKWIYQPALPVECHRSTAFRLAAKPYVEDDRVLLPQVEKRRRGAAGGPNRSRT